MDTSSIENGELMSGSWVWACGVLFVVSGCQLDGGGYVGSRASASEVNLEEEDAGFEELVGESGWAVPPGDPEAEEEAAGVNEGEVVELDEEPSCGDGVMDDCVPVDVDVDGDGVVAAFDCDDLDAGRSPKVEEVLCNGIDENCNDVDDCDRDGDGIRDVDDLDPDVPAQSYEGPRDAIPREADSEWDE